MVWKECHRRNCRRFSLHFFELSVHVSKWSSHLLFLQWVPVSVPLWDFETENFKWKLTPSLPNMGSLKLTEGLTHWKANRVILLSPKSDLLRDSKGKYVSLSGCPNPNARWPSPTVTSLSMDTAVTWALLQAESLLSLGVLFQLLKESWNLWGTPKGEQRFLLSV